MLTISNNKSFMPGVYINQAKIVGAIDISGQPTYQDNPESVRDLAVELEFDIGKEWTKKVIIKGNLKINPRSPKVIDDWGSAFVVKDLFIKLGCFDNLTKEEQRDKLKIFSMKEVPVDFLVKLIGLNVFTLDYVKGISEEGKLKYATWNIVDTDEDRLAIAFKSSYAKGYPNNYKPELLNSLPSASTLVTQPINTNEEVPEEDFIF
jgi:hypothetical protein